VAACAPQDRKGKLTILGSEGPKYFYRTFYHHYICNLLVNIITMIYNVYKKKGQAEARAFAHRDSKLHLSVTLNVTT
jgi:hypothetical protein